MSPLYLTYLGLKLFGRATGAFHDSCDIDMKIQSLVNQVDPAYQKQLRAKLEADRAYVFTLVLADRAAEDKAYEESHRGFRHNWGGYLALGAILYFVYGIIYAILYHA